jgi:hypothetical protein
VIVLSADDAKKAPALRNSEKRQHRRVVGSDSGATGQNLPSGASFDLASNPTNPARLYANAQREAFLRHGHGSPLDQMSAAVDALLTIATT